MSNPYSGIDFFSFLLLLIQRLWALFTGRLPLTQLAPDEVQLVVLLSVAISAALVGCFLVLRKMTMLANSLSHTVLLGIVVAYVLTRSVDSGTYQPLSLPVMFIAAVISGIVTTFLTEFLAKRIRLQEDASIGLVFTSLFALGVFLVTLLTRSAHIGTEAVMGNADALFLEDIAPTLWILGFNLLITLLFYRKFQLLAFDPGFAKTLGISLFFYHSLQVVQVSTTVVGAFRAVGVVLVLGLIVGPPLIARMFVRSLKGMLILSALVGCLAVLFGVATARHVLSVYGMPLSTGGLVVCYVVGFYLLGLVGLVLYRRSERRAISNTGSVEEAPAQ